MRPRMFMDASRTKMLAVTIAVTYVCSNENIANHHRR